MSKYNDVPVVTIDGPSGTGKGTMTCLLAEHLGWNLLDSGAIYRLHAYKALSENISLDNESSLESIALELDIRFEYQRSTKKILAFLDGEDVSSKIRTEKVGMSASKASAFPKVRKALLERQRGFAIAPGLVTDGRDMGSVVFPEASVKFYLDASCKERAKRRQIQLQQAGVDVKFGPLLDEIIERDHRDKSRSASPLVVPDGAAVINTDNLTIDDVFQRMLLVIQRRLGL